MTEQRTKRKAIFHGASDFSMWRKINFYKKRLLFTGIYGNILMRNLKKL